MLAMGGAIAAVENAYMKQRLVESHTRRLPAIEAGETVVVGVNAWHGARALAAHRGRPGILRVDETAEREQIERLEAFRRRRSGAEVAAALRALSDAVKAGANVMPPSIRCAHAGVTTGEWSDALRSASASTARRPASSRAVEGAQREALAKVRGRVRASPSALGRPLKILVGKPGLDGHSNGAEQIAVRARDVGLEVVYEGIRLTPDEIATSAREEGVHVIGLSILSGSHGVLVVDVLDELRASGCGDVPWSSSAASSPRTTPTSCGARACRRVYTPKDFDLTRIMDEIVDVVAGARAVAA